MEENKVNSSAESTERRSADKKDYHSPELVEYGDIRQLTQTNPNVISHFDGGQFGFLEITAP